MLELNVINAGDIDREMRQLAAGVYDPRAAAWLKRVARFFVINIEQLLAPQKVKAELRGGTRQQAGQPHLPPIEGASKYHFHPSGKWLGRGPDPALPSAPSEIEPETWRTQFHQPGVRHDIERSFTPFVPKKAKTTGVHGGPPPKKKLAPWMKTYQPPSAPPTAEPEAESDKLQHTYTGLYHFDPIQVRRRELFMRLYDAASYFNWMTQVAKKANSDDVREKEEAKEANLLFRRLETMQTADREGFNDIMQQSAQFAHEVEENPYKFSNIKPTVVHRFEDGYTWVHLHTQLQFEQESDQMHHCIGNAGYWNKFEQGRGNYYSLRDPNGIPHVTIEVDTGRPPSILQIRGTNNSRPAPRYQPYLRPFFNAQGWRVADAYNVD